ncbi:MAG: alpha/beta fold hydrolase [Pseudomonadota bacterium]
MGLIKVFGRVAARILVLGLFCAVLALGFRAFEAWRGPHLSLWHTYVPPELTVAELDATDWAGYLAAEARAFAAVRANVSDRLPADEQTRFNRYFPGAANFPGGFPTDWNRSFMLQPQGPITGVAVLVHGLTDSPYSLRHFARLYAARGFTVLALRVPGHGTVPSALLDMGHETWRAAVRLAMREARRLAGPQKPIHLMGYSNGGALAVLHSLDAIEQPDLVKPDQIVLISPMIGVTQFARLAPLAALPAFVPGFEAARWLDLLPEYNPFKYNSFPANAAAQSYQLTQLVQARLSALSSRLAAFPPVLTFQSVVDQTVSAEAVVNGLHMRLPSGRSELVLFDVNRDGPLDFLLTQDAKTALERLLPAAPRPFRSVVVVNAAADLPQGGSASTGRMEARMVEAGETGVRRTPLAPDMVYPPTVYSLSHVAMPFPLSDGLYGISPDAGEAFGIRIGDLVARGERGAFRVGEDVLMRIASNPFLPFMFERLGATLTPPASQGPPPAR